MNQVQQFLQYLLDFIKIWVIVQPWQTGIRARNGKRIKVLHGGIHFKFPYFDSVYVQEKRLRMVSLSIQTLTSRDLKTITLNGAIGYAIVDIEKLYQGLFHPETTMANMVMSEISEFVFSKRLGDISPLIIEKAVSEKLDFKKYGIEFRSFKIMNFAVVRTYRLIQDQSWLSESLGMDTKQ